MTSQVSQLSQLSPYLVSTLIAREVNLKNEGVKRRKQVREKVVKVVKVVKDQAVAAQLRDANFL